MLFIIIYDYSIRKVALLFSARGGRCLAENVAAAFPDGHKRGRDYGGYDKTNPLATGMIAATSKSGRSDTRDESEEL
jgi:hypothetical protein